MDRHDWDERYRTHEYVWSAEPNLFLPPEVAGRTPGRALDLGAGEGRNAVWLAAQGWSVTAIDFSEVGLEKGRRLAADQGVTVDWVHADVLEYEPPDDAFDLVILFYLQLPPEQRRAALERAVHALASGGVLLVVAHDLRNLDEGHGGPPVPEVLWDPEETESWLHELDDAMIVERSETVGRPVTTDAGEVIALDTLVRARRP